MSDTIVFRVQDAEGRGPFRPGFSHKWVEDRPDHDNLLPWIFEFGDIRKKAIVGMALGCGCLSVEQLRRWFTPKEYTKLRAFGYRAVKLRVGRVLASSATQCVFERAKPLTEDAEPFSLFYVDDKPENGHDADAE